MKYLKKYIPSREALENHRMLALVRHRLDGKPYLWSFEQNPVVKATLIGVFWAMMPMPFQMLPALVFCLLFRANLMVAVAWVWVSNPFTMLPILYCSYYIGCKALGLAFSGNLLKLDFDHHLLDFQHVLMPLVLGSLIVGCVCALFFSLLVWVAYQLKASKLT